MIENRSTTDGVPRDVPAVPSSSLIFGSVKEFFLGPIKFLTQARNELGDTFRFRAGPKWFYIFTHPDHIKEIFAKNWQIFPKEQNSRAVIGESLLTSEGEIWARQRKHSQKYFAKGHLNSLFATMHETISNRHKQLKEKANNSSSFQFDMHAYTVDVICDLVVALLYKARPQADFSQMVGDVDLMVDYIRRYSSTFLKLPLWIPTPANRQFAEARKRFADFVAPLHKEATEAGRENILHHLAADPQASPEELHNEALTFYVAGFETTANALFWTLHLLAKRPDAIEKIKKEIESQDLSQIQNFDDLKNLPWIRACVMEGLRLYPVAWFRSKIAAQDEPVGGFLVKKGSVVWVCTYLTHRTESLFPNANQFLPERFLPGQIESQTPFSYVPFGGGRTVCIGREMAIMELVAVIAHFFKDFDLDTSAIPEVKEIPSITIRPGSPWLARVSVKA